MPAKKANKNVVTLVSNEYGDEALYLNGNLLETQCGEFLFRDVISYLGELPVIFEEINETTHHEDFPDHLSELNKNNIFDVAKELDSTLRQSGLVSFVSVGINHNKELIIHATKSTDELIKSYIKMGYDGYKVKFLKTLK